MRSPVCGSVANRAEAQRRRLSRARVEEAAAAANPEAPDGPGEPAAVAAPSGPQHEGRARDLVEYSASEAPDIVRGAIAGRCLVAALGAGEHEVQGQCSVCLVPFDPEERVLRLPCLHVFHVTCGTRSLATDVSIEYDGPEGEHASTHFHMRCPVCRVSIADADAVLRVDVD